MWFDTCTDSPNCPVWSQPFEKDGLEPVLQGVTGLPSEGGDLLPLLPQHGVRDPEGRHQLSEMGKKTYKSGDILRQRSHQVTWFLTLLLCTQSWIALLRFGEGEY